MPALRACHATFYYRWETLESRRKSLQTCDTRDSLTLGSLLRSKTESRQHVRVVQLLLHLHPCKYVSTVAVLTLWDKQQLWRLISTRLQISLPAMKLSERVPQPPSVSNPRSQNEPITQLLWEWVELASAYGFQSALGDWFSPASGDSVKRIEFPVTGIDFMTLLVTHAGKLVVAFFPFSWSLISWILHSAPWIKLQRQFSLHYLVC